MKNPKLFVFALPLMVFAGGCRNQFPAPGELQPDTATPVDTLPSPREEKQESVLQVTAKTNKAAYKSTEPVEFTIKLRNTSDKPQEVTFSSGQNFDITVTPVDGEKPIWRWSAGRFFTMALRTQTLQPGEEKSWTTKWDQQTTNAEGQKSLAPRGAYTASAKLTIVGGLEAPALSFNLTE